MVIKHSTTLKKAITTRSLIQDGILEKEFIDIIDDKKINSNLINVDKVMEFFSQWDLPIKR